MCIPRRYVAEMVEDEIRRGEIVAQDWSFLSPLPTFIFNDAFIRIAEVVSK